MKKSIITMLMLLMLSALAFGGGKKESISEDTSGDVLIYVKVPDNVPQEDIIVVNHRGNGNIQVDLSEEYSIGGITTYTGTIENTGVVGSVKISVCYKTVNPDTGLDEYRYVIGDINGPQINPAISSFEKTISDIQTDAVPDPDALMDVDAANYVNSANLIIPSTKRLTFSAGVNYDKDKPLPNGNVYHKKDYIIGGKKIDFTLLKPGSITSYYTTEVTVKARVEGYNREGRSTAELSTQDTPGNFKVTSSEIGGQ